MTEKRLIVDENYNLVDTVTGEWLDDTQVFDLANELAEENQSIKKHIRELYRIVKIDVDNEIEVYPKVMLEYLINILKIIGDVE